VHLVGELGAGKTTLVRGAARALGITEPVTSPTFTIANRYVGRREIGHVDAWRMGAEDDEGLEIVLEPFADAAILFVEWPDAVAAHTGPPTVLVELAHGGGERRLVRLSAPDPAISTAIARQLANARARHGRPEPKPGRPEGG
jgi:tRNA threonylcarbamoyladenosine biosynthesis protein TsaE